MWYQRGRASPRKGRMPFIAAHAAKTSAADGHQSRVCVLNHSWYSSSPSRTCYIIEKYSSAGGQSTANKAVVECTTVSSGIVRRWSCSTIAVPTFAYLLYAHPLVVTFTPPFFSARASADSVAMGLRHGTLSSTAVKNNSTVDTIFPRYRTGK